MKQLSTASTIATLFLVLQFNTAASQEQARIEFGAKAGIGTATWSGSGIFSTDHSSISVLGGGVFVRLNLPNSPVTFQPEMLLVQNGVKHPDTESPYGETEAKYKLTYFAVPLLVGFRLPTNSTISTNLFAGPILSVLASANRTEKGSGFDEETDISNDLKSIELGMALGAGVSVPVGKTGALVFDGRYDLGLSNIIDDNSGESIKNRSLRVFAGYAIRLGR